MLDDYQTAETAWRYDYLVSDTLKEIRSLEDNIVKEQAVIIVLLLQLKQLRQCPPRYNLFNWSA